jgi:hypothetical protein
LKATVEFSLINWQIPFNTNATLITFAAEKLLPWLKQQKRNH